MTDVPPPGPGEPPRPDSPAGRIPPDTPADEPPGEPDAGGVPGADPPGPPPAAPGDDEPTVVGRSGDAPVGWPEPPPGPDPADAETTVLGTAPDRGPESTVSFDPPADAPGPPADAPGPPGDVPGSPADAPGSSADVPGSSAGVPGPSAGVPGAPGGSTPDFVGEPGRPGAGEPEAGFGGPAFSGVGPGPAGPGSGAGFGGAGSGGPAGAPGGGAAAAGPTAYERPRLRRSSQRKVVAGVARGFGDYTGIDPVLFRVLFAVLTLFGGTGILLYIIGWLFLPADDQEVSPAESLIGRGSGRAGDAVKAVLLVVAGLFLAGVLARGDAGDVVLLLVVVGVVVYLIRTLPERRGETPPPAPAAPPPVYQPYEQPAAFEQRAGGTATAVAAPPVPPPAPPGPPKRRRERSALGLITLSVLLIALGIVAATDGNGGTDVAAKTYLALGTGIIGLGLLVGAVLGRARWLVWLGIPVLVTLVAVGSVDIDVSGGTGERLYEPRTVAEVQSDYRLGVGSLDVDLRAVDFTGRPTRVRVTAGLGEVVVTVPRNADVRVVGSVDLGEVDLLGQRDDGATATRTVVDRGVGGDGETDLELEVDVNVGSVEVKRAQA